jgi:hypothetical protein
MTRSKLITPALISAARSSKPTISAPRRLGRSRLLALGEDGDADRLAGTGRQNHRTTNDLIRLPRIDAETDGTSIDSSNLAVAHSLASFSASPTG